MPWTILLRSVDVFGYSPARDGQKDEHGPVECSQPQPFLKGILLSGDGIDQCPARIDPQGSLKGIKTGCVNAQGRLSTQGYLPYRLRQGCSLIKARHAHIHIDDGRTLFHLVPCKRAGKRKLARQELLLEVLLARRVNAFSNNGKRSAPCPASRSLNVS